MTSEITYHRMTPPQNPESVENGNRLKKYGKLSLYTASVTACVSVSSFVASHLLTEKQQETAVIVAIVSGSISACSSIAASIFRGLSSCWKKNGNGDSMERNFTPFFPSSRDYVFYENELPQSPVYRPTTFMP